MADISEWSPVDESNNQPPPAGWPEGMAPSAINNSARAMMGAVRRFYDTTTAQLTSITASLSNYLPLSGGTLTGILHAPHLHATGNITADAAIAGDSLNVAAAITAGGDITGAGNISGNTITGNHLQSNGNITATGDITANDIAATGTVSGVNFWTSNGVLLAGETAGNPLLYKAGGGWGMQLQASTTYYDNSVHVFRNATPDNTFTIDASGNVNATAQVQGNTIHSRGTISATGAISTNGIITTTGNMYAGGSVEGAYVKSRGDVRADGTFSTGGGLYATGLVDAGGVTSRGDASVTGVAYLNAINMSGALQTSNWIRPFVDHGCNICLPAFNADSMHAYSFIVPSDARLKSDIDTPTGCLELLQAIPPRTYRLPGAPDPDTVHWGLVAGEVKDALQGRAFGGYRKDPTSGEEGLAVNEMLALLWGAVRELAAKLEEVNAR